MPHKTFAHGGAILVAMDRPRNHSGVIIQRTNERMLVQERQRFLLGGFAPHESADRFELPAAVRQGDFAGFFQRLTGVFLGQREQAL